MSNKILFFGNERLATGVTTMAPTLHGLVEAGYEVAALVLAQSDQGPSRRSREPEIVQVAKEYGVPVLAPAKLKDAVEDLAAYQADIGVLVAYGKIVPQAIIDIFPHGIVNIHPSLLPRHRGPIPVEAAMLEAPAETGVSIMQLTKALDAGPVYAQARLALGGSRLSKQTLADALLGNGGELLLQHLPGILAGTTIPKPQDESQATYDERLQRSDGLLNWQKSATQLEREVRAYAGWPRSYTELDNTNVIVTEAAALDQIMSPGEVTIEDKRLIVGCHWGALEIKQLIPAGKKPMPATAFIAGHFQQ